ncbi:matrilin-4 [Lingula anatina]|uniref:Matrilin-4 n=1 Tax=Lingula anatina TaxID=7574 RepID=A0A1S3IIS0_LINAN|nr:matrilin-4 [Lingula anatina]|eukprot:XP_013398107.1 matrilin-4 [Lingula anatina]
MKTTGIQAFIICVTLVFIVEGRDDQDTVAKKILDKISSFLTPKKVVVPRGPAGPGGPSVRGPAGPRGTSRGATTTYVTPNLDFLYVLDSSGSIGSEHFDKAKKGVQAQVDVIDLKSKISPSGTHVGLIEFSSPAKTHVEFTLRQYTSAAAIKAAVGKINYDDGRSTATADALRLAKKHFDQYGVRENVKVAWVITDGQSNRGGNPKIPADELKKNGVEICVVGIGNNINWKEIKDIAMSDCHFDVESYEALLGINEKTLTMARAAVAAKARAMARAAAAAKARALARGRALAKARAAMAQARARAMAGRH